MWVGRCTWGGCEKGARNEPVFFLGNQFASRTPHTCSCSSVMPWPKLLPAPVPAPPHGAHCGAIAFWFCHTSLGEGSCCSCCDSWACEARQFRGIEVDAYMATTVWFSHATPCIPGQACYCRCCRPRSTWQDSRLFPITYQACSTVKYSTGTRPEYMIIKQTCFTPPGVARPAVSCCLHVATRSPHACAAVTHSSAATPAVTAAPRPVPLERVQTTAAARAVPSRRCTCYH